MADHPYGKTSVAELIACGDSREAMVSWLIWNDRNGIFSDNDCDREGIPRLTVETARALILEILSRN